MQPPGASRVLGPAWFEEALAAPCAEGAVTCDGARIHYLHWGTRGHPGLILVHGGAAHAHWWSFLAPLLTSHYDVVALDLSGHGDSGRRESYPRETWAAEVMAVSDAMGFPGPPVIIGHSLGGLVAILVASLYGTRLAGAIIVDSPVHKPSPETDAARSGFTFHPLKVYPTEDAALARFKLVPPQPCDNPFIIDYIARESLHMVESGFSWKFDPNIFTSINTDQMSDHLAQVKCRVALLRGEFSTVVPRETSDYMVELLDRAAPLVEIPQAHHHLILDQPLAFIAAARALLADWEHSTPHRRPQHDASSHSGR
jgi:pimeloyl-ACP methyl ester carboxylesterase